MPSPAPQTTTQTSVVTKTETSTLSVTKCTNPPSETTRTSPTHWDRSNSGVLVAGY
jgi:hypothetical protein